MGSVRERGGMGGRIVPVFLPRDKPRCQLVRLGPRACHLLMHHLRVLSHPDRRYGSEGGPGPGPANSGSVGLQCCLSFPFGKLIYHLPENILVKTSETLSYKRSL